MESLLKGNVDPEDLKVRKPLLRLLWWMTEKDYKHI